MAFFAILRKSASSLALTASRLARANKNNQSAVFSASSHLNWKLTLGSFVPDFDFSSATETKKCSSNYESLLEAFDSEIKRDRVEETPSEFTFKIEDDNGEVSVVLTKEFQGELVEVSSGIEYVYDERFMNYPCFSVIISKQGGLALEFYCSYLDDAISIIDVTVGTKENLDEGCHLDLDFKNLDVDLQKALLKYLEIRGIEPSIFDFMCKCIINKYTQRNLTEMKKIMKNFIEGFG
ncbi:hypothetical protein EZV62_025721 [Acer yangbiense]|uniref:Mitochondrial glycoprotein domain-containing protein n=1 Tax=Acer yangbiense TaxID=1000413 RepID=A0A5C7H0N4_9ROSI|nr:hypothetical protein EZV62_025721 [Acer yangbiense]